MRIAVAFGEQSPEALGRVVRLRWRDHLLCTSLASQCEIDIRLRRQLRDIAACRQCPRRLDYSAMRRETRGANETEETSWFDASIQSASVRDAPRECRAPRGRHAHPAFAASAGALPQAPEATSSARWAREAPDRVFLAERAPTKGWRRVGYSQMLGWVESLAQALLRPSVVARAAADGAVREQH